MLTSVLIQLHSSIKDWSDEQIAELFASVQAHMTIERILRLSPFTLVVGQASPNAIWWIAKNRTKEVVQIEGNDPVTLGSVG